LVDDEGEMSMPRVMMVLIILFAAPFLSRSLRADQERGVLERMPVLTADAPEQLADRSPRASPGGRGS
jgi:hypothetical protein